MTGVLDLVVRKADVLVGAVGAELLGGEVLGAPVFLKLVVVASRCLSPTAFSHNSNNEVFFPEMF